MAAIALGVVGSAVGGAIGGTILGVSAATIGGAIGAGVGSMVDSWVLNQMFGPGPQRIEGSRLEAGRITSASEGGIIPRAFGRYRLGGNIIWATDFREEIKTDRQGGGGKGGGGPEIITTTYLYYASFAVALCEGEITGVGRIWADGKPLNREGVTWRWHPGSETQVADTLIASMMGAETPAYRGTAYVVFEDILLESFGNRIPQLTFEVFRAVDDEDTAEGAVKAVTIIPASGEFIYATEKVSRTVGDGQTEPENVNANTIDADFSISLDRLLAAVPGIESVSLVVAWFGDDLRAGECRILPGVENATKETSKAWTVDGVSRGNAYVVSQDAEGRPVYGGTPSDFAVVQAIQECKARGLRVTFYPFILMDVPAGNDLPNPYSDNAGEEGQAVFPWRGRITCSPATGYAGTVDKTSAAATQIDALFGAAAVDDFTVSGTTVTYGGAAEWSWRRMILHYAHLCDAAGGVDSFLIGSEMRGMTHVRDGNGAYPAVAQLIGLAEDCRSVLGSGTAISYAADWSEYFGHQPADGSGDVYFNLDQFWSSDDVDFVGIDNYMPLSDWRDGFEHADAEDAEAIYERAYLQGNIEGGEGFEWYYASSADRAEQDRTAISDGAEGKDWVFRYKDVRSWWSSQHFDRPGGSESETATAWVPESKPIRFTEFGCPAVDRGANQPNVFYDPKSSESFFPYFSRGWRDDAIQRAYLEAVLLYWGDNANNPASSEYSGRMIDVDECAAWTWDARPYPWFPALSDVWADGDNWRLGHWLNGRLGSVSLAALVRLLCARAGLDTDLVDVSGLWGAVEGYSITAIESPRASISTLARHFGFDAVESEGGIVFRMRGRAPAASVTLDDLVPPDEGDVIEFTRGQETELPQALKWTVARSDEEYDAATVEARRVTVEASRIQTESFSFAVPPEEAERRARRALQEAWVGRELSSFRLPPSRLALDPSDVIELAHDGRSYDFRLLTTNDGADRAISAMLRDRAAYDLPPGGERATTIAQTVMFGAPAVEFLDLPQLVSEEVAYQPLIGAYAQPWPGSMAVFRSPEDDGFSFVNSFSGRARFGVLVDDFYGGPPDRFDLGNVLTVDLLAGSLQSVTDLQLFDGANVLAVESAAGEWEIVQFGAVELVSSGRYRLTRLLRGQRGTEGAIGDPAAAGARVVILDRALVRLPIGEPDIGLMFNWRVGPARLPYTDSAYVAEQFTPRGVGLRPFAVEHVSQPWRWSRVPGDLVISWVRRTRSLAGDSWSATEVPLDEASEAYEVDILDGSTVLRTLSTSTPSVTYTGADQTADWGAPLAYPDTLDIVVYQLSAAYGRGAPRSEKLYF